MKKQFLISKQLDRYIETWNAVRSLPPPKEGWIRTLRKALGMTTKQLAKRLRVNRSRVVKIEQAELDSALTVKTLREVASALNCKFVYALVPQTSLREVLEQQAKKVATKYINRVGHSMLLEEQSVDPAIQQEQLIEMINELLSGALKNLWNEE